MNSLQKTWLVAAMAVPLGLIGCSDDEESTGGAGASGGSGATAGSGASGGSGGSSASGGSGGSGGGTATLCDKYGGPTVVAGAISGQVFPAIAGDCRISAWFTSLTPTTQTHVLECLTIQAQELFGCEGFTYAGSKSSIAPCRSMTETHANLGISKGDFDALIEDVAAGLTAAGVEAGDIAKAAPALLGMESAIVEDTSSDNTKPGCSTAGTGGTGGTGTGGTGGGTAGTGGAG